MFQNITKATFLKRVNRFVAQVLVDGKTIDVHVADTGRLKEILTEGRTVYITKTSTGKTDGKLLFAQMEDGLVLINTSYHSKIASIVIRDYLFKDRNITIKPEFKYKDSRIDFLIDENILIEVKGCNLVVDNICLFPDAPTLRGAKHLKHLIESIKDGYRPMLLILAFRECGCFFPNEKTDKNFAQMFKQAIKLGVEVNVFKVKIGEDFRVKIGNKIPVCEEKWALQKISSL